MTGVKKMKTEKKVPHGSLKPGDVFWFSGFWCVFVCYGADGKAYGRFPYTPPDKKVWMFTTYPEPTEYEKKYGPMMVTVKEGATVKYDPTRSPW